MLLVVILPPLISVVPLTFNRVKPLAAPPKHRIAAHRQPAHPAAIHGVAECHRAARQRRRCPQRHRSAITLDAAGRNAPAVDLGRSTHVQPRQAARRATKHPVPAHRQPAHPAAIHCVAECHRAARQRRRRSQGHRPAVTLAVAGRDASAVDRGVPCYTHARQTVGRAHAPGKHRCPRHRQGPRSRVAINRRDKCHGRAAQIHIRLQHHSQAGCPTRQIHVRADRGDVMPQGQPARTHQCDRAWLRRQCSGGGQRPAVAPKSMLPVPVLKLVTAGKVSVVPAIAVIPVFAPSAGAANVNVAVRNRDARARAVKCHRPDEVICARCQRNRERPGRKARGARHQQRPALCNRSPSRHAQTAFDTQFTEGNRMLKSNVTLPAPLPPVVLRLPLPLNVVPSAAKLPPLVATAVLTATAAPWIVTAEVKLPSKLVMVAEFVPRPH